VLPLKFGLPLYVAMMLCVPEVNVEVENVGDLLKLTGVVVRGRVVHQPYGRLPHWTVSVTADVYAVDPPTPVTVTV